MKKLFVTMLSILACGAAYALPVGNPSDASLLNDGLIWEGFCGDPCDPCLSWCDAWSIRVGFYGDYVFNRHMEVDEDGTNSDDIEHTQIYTNAGLVTLNLWDRFDIFAMFGATNMFIDTNAVSFGGPIGSRIEIETETEFSWSVGGRATLWECGCTTLGIEGQYFRTRPDVKRITVSSSSSVYPDSYLDLTYTEWQVGAGISHRINMFVPYIAVKYARSYWDFHGDTIIVPGLANPLRANDLNAKKHWGYALGVSLIDCEKASITAEGRFGDEKAVYINGQVRF